MKQVITMTKKQLRKKIKDKNSHMELVILCGSKHFTKLNKYLITTMKHGI